jgi:hypothetical protein
MLDPRPAAVAMLAGVLLVGCGQDKVEYQPRTAPSGVQAALPPVPNVPQKPIKAGDAYTIWGASYHLRSRVHHNEVANKQLKLSGYITKTNLENAPECAVHETGKEDPEGCTPPVPAFWLGDTKDAPDKDAIKVMGWASNFAQIYDAIEAYEKDKDKPVAEQEPKMDNFWGVKIPNPLPAKGAKINVKGLYSTTFTRATSGTEADPIMGLVTYDDIETIEQAPEPATLPGMKKK